MLSGCSTGSHAGRSSSACSGLSPPAWLCFAVRQRCNSRSSLLPAGTRGACCLSLGFPRALGDPAVLVGSIFSIFFSLHFYSPFVPRYNAFLLTVLFGSSSHVRVC